MVRNRFVGCERVLKRVRVPLLQPLAIPGTGTWSPWSFPGVNDDHWTENVSR